MEQLLSDDLFERFREIIKRESGIHFSDSNRSILESRLRERLRTSGTASVRDYLTRIETNDEELKVLLDSVTTNLTRFFRNQAHFEALEREVVPDLVRRKRGIGDPTIRVWSAGCSTGEEPYSIAMLLDDLLPVGMSFELVASDLSLKSLMTAREGYYPESRMNGVPDRYRRRYFKTHGDGFAVTDEIKKRIRFDYHNLKFDSGQRDLDLVLCRNVIIYFDDEAKRAVIDRFWTSMNAYSYLFIGHSESLFGMDSRFAFHKTESATCYVKRVGTGVDG